jgi:dynein heavy chain
MNQNFEINFRYLDNEPEIKTLPNEWEEQCNEFQKMLIIRSCRSDRMMSCLRNFIIHKLGQVFVEPPVLDMKSVFEDSTERTPLIFVLSPGVDPTNSLLQLAENQEMGNRFMMLSLGQGQAPIATKYIFYIISSTKYKRKILDH